MTNQFKLNQLQKDVFNAIHSFNRNASFEYAEWLKERQHAAQDMATKIMVGVEEAAKPAVAPLKPAVAPFTMKTVEADFSAIRVKVRKMRNGRNIAAINETDFLLVDPNEEHLARQIDEVSLSYSSIANGWSTAIVTRANGKQIVAPYPTVPQFLKRANIRAKRKHGVAQSQPLNFSKAVY